MQAFVTYLQYKAGSFLLLVQVLTISCVLEHNASDDADRYDAIFS